MYPDQKTYEIVPTIVTQGDTSTPTVVEVKILEKWKEQTKLIDVPAGIRFQLCNDGTHTESTNATIAPTTGWGTTRTTHSATKELTIDSPLAAVKATGVLTISGVVIDGESFTINGRDYYFSSGRTTSTGDVDVEINSFGTKSQGTLTVIDAPTAGDTMTIGSTVYTFVSAQAVPGDIAVGAAAVPEVADMTCVADVSDSLDQTYFVLQDTAGPVVFWIDTDDSGSTISAAATAAATGGRSVEITTVTTDMTNSQVAGVVATAINADAQFSASAASEVVTITNAEDGDFGAGADGDSGFTFAVTTAGVDASGQDEIVAAINGTDGYNTANDEVTCAAFVDNDAVLTAIYTGTQGDSIVTTETFTAAASVFDAATLGTTTAGVDVSASDAGDAIDTAVAADTNSQVTSSNSAGTVTFTANENGAFYNAYTTTELMANGAFGGATMSGGTTAKLTGIIRVSVTDATAETITLRFGQAALDGVPANYFEVPLDVTHAAP